MEGFEARERKRRISQITTVPTFLDSVFMYSLYKKKQVYCHFPEITLREALGNYDEAELAACLLRASQLWACTTAIGESGHRYPGAMPMSGAVRQMIENHPGYSDDCYNEVIDMGTLAMR